MSGHLVEEGVSHAYVNWGRWVADCPAPFCRSALNLAPGEPTFRCNDCRAVGAVVWPVNVPDIAYLLAMRPDPVTRNWVPGETIHDLLAENLLHGVMPPAVEQGGRVVLAGDRIAEGALAAGEAHLMIGA